MGLSSVNEGTPLPFQGEISNATGTGIITPVSAPFSFPWRVDYIYASNSDSGPHTVRISIFNNSATVHFADVTLPAGAGYTAAPTELLAAAGLTSGLGLFLSPLQVVQINATVAMPVGQTLDFVGQAGTL